MRSSVRCRSRTCSNRRSRSRSAAMRCRRSSRTSGRPRCRNSRGCRVSRTPSCRMAAHRRWASACACRAMRRRCARCRRKVRARSTRGARRAHRRVLPRRRGALAAADLQAYRPEWVEPIGKRFGRHTIHEIPPNGQGIAALIALGIAEHAGVTEWPVDSVDSQHLQIEAMKLAFADVYRYVADPRAMVSRPNRCSTMRISPSARN